LNRLSILIAAALISGGAFAQSAAPASQPQTQATAGAFDFTEAEVRKVDRSAGKITLRHGEIKSLDMPAMTMVFTAAKPEMLDQVKTGDKVRFRATNQGGTYTVTEIQSVK